MNLVHILRLLVGIPDPHHEIEIPKRAREIDEVARESARVRAEMERRVAAVRAYTEAVRREGLDELHH